MGSSLAPFLALAIIDCIFVTMNLAFCHILFYSTQQLIHLFSSQEWGLQQICHCLFVTSHNMSMVRVFTLSCLASQYTFFLHCQTVYAPHWLTSCLWMPLLSKVHMNLPFSGTQVRAPLWTIADHPFLTSSPCPCAWALASQEEITALSCFNISQKSSTNKMLKPLAASTTMQLIQMTLKVLGV